MGQQCSLEADLYSFGILLIELITQEQISAHGECRLPHAPLECPQVGWRMHWVSGCADCLCREHTGSVARIAIQFI
jgi:hypothetical protein